jgi:hypothetical protein
MSANAAYLNKNGYVVICAPWFTGKDVVARMRAEFEKEVLKFPEFKVRPKFADVRTFPGGLDRYDETTTPYLRYGLGGTSFLGAPSFQHNAFVRRLRDKVMHTLITHLFRAYVRDILRDEKREYKLHQFLDRAMIRPAGDVALAESWHRDIAPGMSEDDLTFGGWINLDSVDQVFTCVRKTHKKNLHTDEPYTSRSRGKKGFAKIDSIHTDAYENAPGKIAVKIPPGCILVFQEDLVHKVTANPLNYTSVRQFFAWRLTKSNNMDLIPDAAKNIRHQLTNDAFKTLLRAQAVIPLKSGQWPDMYSPSIGSYLKPRATKFVTENLVEGAMKPSPRTRVVHSLQDLLTAKKITHMHAPYREHEITMLLPGDAFHLTNPETGFLELISLHDDGHASAGPSHRASSSAQASSWGAEENVFDDTIDRNRKKKKKKTRNSLASRSDEENVFDDTIDRNRKKKKKKTRKSQDDGRARTSAAGPSSRRASPEREVLTVSDSSSDSSSGSEYATPDYYSDNDVNMARAVQLSMKPWSGKEKLKELKKKAKVTRKKKSPKSDLSDEGVHLMSDMEVADYLRKKKQINPF